MQQLCVLTFWEHNSRKKLLQIARKPYFRVKTILRISKKVLNIFAKITKKAKNAKFSAREASSLEVWYFHKIFEQKYNKKLVHLEQWQKILLRWWVESTHVCKIIKDHSEPS